MKRLALLVLVIGALLFTGCSGGGVGVNPEKEAVLATITLWEEGNLKQDPTILGQVIAESIEIGIDDIIPRDTYLKYYVASHPRLIYELENIKVSISGDKALVTSRLLFNRSESLTHEFNYSIYLKKSDNKWLIYKTNSDWIKSYPYDL